MIRQRAIREINSGFVFNEITESDYKGNGFSNATIDLRGRVIDLNKQVEGNFERAEALRAKLSAGTLISGIDYQWLVEWETGRFGNPPMKDAKYEVVAREVTEWKTLQRVNKKGA